MITKADLTSNLKMLLEEALSTVGGLDPEDMESTTVQYTQAAVNLQQAIDLLFAEHLFLFDCIERERSLQDEKWGEQNHSMPVWLSVLMEEVGEVSKEVLQMRVADPFRQSLLPLKKELIQCAAVVVAMLEYIERQEAKGTPINKIVGEKE